MSFTVRPAGTDKDPFRIRLTAVSMLSLKLRSGDVCEIVHGENTSGKRKLAVAWEGLGPGMKDTIVQTSKTLQEVYGFKLGDKITISRSPHPIEDAERVTLRTLNLPLDDEEIRSWSKRLSPILSAKDDFITIMQKIQVSERIEFVVKDVGLPNAMIARLRPTTIFRIVNGDASEGPQTIQFNPTTLGGIDEQINKVRFIMNEITHPTIKQIVSIYEPAQGILLYGAKGTGKSTMIEALAKSNWPVVLHWKPGTSVLAATEPRLVVVPEEYLVSKSGLASSIVTELKSFFESIKETPTLVIAEARHPNDVDERLRTHGRFAAEIELPIPSAPGRKEILLAMRGGNNNLTDELVEEMAQRTHGYVGLDLKRLLCETIEIALKRSPATGQDDGELFVMKSVDLDAALKTVRPSALQEVFLETPNVRWSDIGGQHEIKRQLQNAVEGPIKLAERMKKFRLTPKKGVLLYGPPGCSKTLLVRALATEAGLNFLAVKGAELVSMYVGESERATREIFRKARAASPSIIFFDEIDAIASRGRSGSDLNVLTTLLNEMDGFEELRDVFVVAATNKPQQIDPALMRPGRFDSVVYIGPPDSEARKEILHKQLGQGLYEHESHLAADVDSFSQWTEGFSGADVVAICKAAGEAALYAGQEFIRFEDIQTAVANTPKSITRDMLEEYETWNTARRAR